MASGQRVSWQKQKKTRPLVESSWSGYQDSNLGPPAPKAGALTGLRYIPLLLNCGAKVQQFFYPANFFATFLQKLLFFSVFVAQFLFFDAPNLKN